MPTFHMSRTTAGFAASVLALTALMAPLDARQAAGTGACRISGRASSGTTPLPGVSVTIRIADALKSATSTETDGGYALNLPPGQYTLTAELTGFTRVERPLVVGDGACAQTIDLSLTLAPRQPIAPAPLTSSSRAGQPAVAPAAGRGAQPNGRGGRGASGFETVQVQAQADQPN